MPTTTTETVPVDPPTDPPRRKRRWLKAPPGWWWWGPAILLAVMAYRHRWTSDGGFRYFRVVEQLQGGNGPVFNAGERVEAVTSPLWLGLVTVADAVLPVRLEYLGAGLALAASAAGIALAGFGAARLARLEQPEHPRLVPVGLLTFVVLWPVWVWSTSGTEIGLALAWIGACVASLANWAAEGDSESRVSRRVLVLLGLGWLIRPELAAANVIFVGVTVVMSTTDRRKRRRMILVAAAVPVAYQLFRMSYYGIPVPSTTLHRFATSTGTSDGWRYVARSATPYLVVVPLAAIALGIGVPLVQSLGRNGHRRAAAVTVAGPMSGALGCIAVAMVGGGAHHGQLLVPSLFLMLAPLGVAAWTRRSAAAVLTVGAWSLLAGVALRPDDGDRFGYVEGGLTIEDRGYSHRGLDQAWLDGPGLYVSDEYGLSAVATGVETDVEVVATPAAATLGYALGTGARIVDLSGPTDPWLGRAASGPLPEAAPWVVATAAADPRDVRPDRDLAGTLLQSKDTPLRQLLDVAWARMAVGCGDPGDAYAAATEPVSVARLTSNLRLALDWSGVGADLDPREAVAAGCPSLGRPLVELGERVVRVPEELPRDADADTLAVVGRCRAVFLREETGGESSWRPLAAAAWQARVTIDPEVGDATVTVFEVGPYDADSKVFGTASVETDGEGSFRVRQDLPWIGEVTGPWTAIEGGVEVTVSYLPSYGGTNWVLYHDFAAIATLPMLTRRDEVVLPGFRAEPPPEGVRVTPRPIVESADCFELLDPLSAIR